MALLDFDTKISTILDSVGSIFEIQRGINIQASAAQYAGVGYRQQAASTQDVAEYNIALDRNQLLKELDVYSREISRGLALQRSQMATTGASVSSKSFLSLQNQILNQASRSIVDRISQQKILADQRRFSAKQQAVELENQARLSEYAAEVSLFQSKQQRNKLIPSLLNQVGSLF